jgi:hypothetical protein
MLRRGVDVQLMVRHIQQGSTPHVTQAIKHLSQPQQGKKIDGRIDCESGCSLERWKKRGRGRQERRVPAHHTATTHHGHRHPSSQQTGPSLLQHLPTPEKGNVPERTCTLSRGNAGHSNTGDSVTEGTRWPRLATTSSSPAHLHHLLQRHVADQDTIDAREQVVRLDTSGLALI